MITTKALPVVKIFFRIFVIAGSTALLAACDHLESDVTRPVVNVIDGEVFTLRDKASIIDLSAKVQTNQPVTLSITRTTRRGTLLTLGKGLLQYVPDPGTVNDSFAFTIYDAGNNLLKEDSVVIVLKDHADELPCALLAVQDSVLIDTTAISLTSAFNVEIPVLDNDIVCGRDVNDLELAVYSVTGGNYLLYGNASVSEKKINYTANGLFTNADAFIYTLQSKSNPSLISYASVYLSVKRPDPSACAFVVHDYRTTLSIDTVSSWPYYINPLGVDTLCYDKQSYQYNVLQSFRGTASIGYDGLWYTPHAFAGLQRTDTVRYAICRDGTCKSANVLITLTQ